MFTFLKAQTASITATIVDFLTMIILVKVFSVWYVIGSAAGTIAGGIAHFSMSRHWVFEARDGKIQSQALKYFMVWCVYLLLSTGLVFLITNYGNINPIISKVIVACLMSVSYNYFMHKKFVFK
ncbi:MAG TPA: GtrA family protein [Puia sp.]|nr:GtrA family protein [Puia sp.]